MAHRLRNHHAQILGRRKNWPKRPLRGPGPAFLGFWPKNGKVLRFLGIGPTASARANRYFPHNSGSMAQNPDFFGSSVAETPRATFGSPENLPETASTGPQIRFLGFLASVGSPKKHKSPGPPKRPKPQKNRNSAKMRPFHRNFCSWNPPPMCSG